MSDFNDKLASALLEEQAENRELRRRLGLSPNAPIDAEGTPTETPDADAERRREAVRQARAKGEAAQKQTATKFAATSARPGGRFNYRAGD